MALFSIDVHTSKHHIDTRNRVRDPFSQFSKDLRGNRDNIHDRIGPSVMVAWFDDLDINLFDMFFPCYEIVQHFLADRHMSVYCNIIMFSKFYVCHMESLDHETSQINFFFSQSSHLHFIKGQMKSHLPFP